MGYQITSPFWQPSNVFPRAVASLPERNAELSRKIAEIIFEEMIRNEKRYEVIPFGYEHTVPTLAQYQHLVEIKQVMKNISDAPDFALISKDKKALYLVEVKYQKVKNMKYIHTYAQELMQRWSISWIFLVTPKGFFCDVTRSIIETGEIKKLSKNWVDEERQKQYLKLLDEFER